MAHTEPHAESLERALQVLRDRLGNQWVGREGAGRAEMVRVLQEALGYDKHQLLNFDAWQMRSIYSEEQRA